MKGNAINMEIWKDISGYEGLYQVNKSGDIKSVERIIDGKKINQRILKKSKDKQGYFIVHLWKNNKREIKGVRRLVADAFINNPENLPYVNHKNEIKTDNCAKNLEWCTHEYNVRYGTGIARMANHKSKAVLQISKSGETIKKWSSAKEAASALGIDDSGIAKSAKGKLKTTGGYFWKYA